MLITPKKPQGFTIIELLIVIVIIAILAAITLVAYSSIQTRANNSAIESAASQTLKLLTAYTSTNGAYPLVSGTGCLVAPVGAANCSWGGVNNRLPNATLTINVSTIGAIPASTPSFADTSYNGIVYSHDFPRTVDNHSAPAIMGYTLIGETTCPVGHIVNGGGPTLLTSTTGYTMYTSSGNTLCIASVPGP